MPRISKQVRPKNRVAPWRERWPQSSESTSTPTTQPAQPCNATRILIAIDIGTTSTTIAYQLYHDNDELTSEHVRSSPTIHVAELETSEISTPMLCRYDDMGKFREGQELMLELEKGLLEESAVLRYSKLALQESESTKHVLKSIKARLHRSGKTVEDLMSDYLRAIIQKARTAITLRSIHGDVSNVPIHLLLCVPEIWAPESDRRCVGG